MFLFGGEKKRGGFVIISVPAREGLVGEVPIRVLRFIEFPLYT
jgi:hypothetical protein